MLSHPLRVRGLKLSETRNTDTLVKSHPLRVRGLKHEAEHRLLHALWVASFTGAWIETSHNSQPTPLLMSHPLRVRGLKRENPILRSC